MHVVESSDGILQSIGEIVKKLLEKKQKKRRFSSLGDLILQEGTKSVKKKFQRFEQLKQSKPEDRQQQTF